jgi:hypothetical protein
VWTSEMSMDSAETLTRHRSDGCTFWRKSSVMPFTSGKYSTPSAHGSNGRSSPW